jgi:hypothetical protein
VTLRGQDPFIYSPMHRPVIFDSFFLGGFECSSHQLPEGRRLDLIEATQHGRLAEHDYRRMAAHGIRTVRDGLRWHLIEARPSQLDFSSFLPMLRAAQRAGTQVIWDLCHYGWPDHIDIWRPIFVERFAQFAAATARVVQDQGGPPPFYCLVNEVSYWSWAGGDHALMSPVARGRGLELKHQLIRAAIAATYAIREVDPRARFVHVDPIINAIPGCDETQDEAQAYMRAQYDSWLLMSGELWPGLGGHPSLLDIVGVNYYSNNQWIVGGPEDGCTVRPFDLRYEPLHRLLATAFARLGRPMLIAETGAEGIHRAPWLDYVVDEVQTALQQGLPIEGICLYPVLDYPGWVDERSCETGLFGTADSDGERPLHDGLARSVANARQRLQAYG